MSPLSFCKLQKHVFRISHPWCCWATKPNLLSWAGGWHHDGKAATGYIPEDWRDLVLSVCTWGKEDRSSLSLLLDLDWWDSRDWESWFPSHCPCFPFSWTLDDPIEDNSKSTFNWLKVVLQLVFVLKYYKLWNHLYKTVFGFLQIISVRIFKHREKWSSFYVKKKEGNPKSLWPFASVFFYSSHHLPTPSSRWGFSFSALEELEHAKHANVYI